MTHANQETFSQHVGTRIRFYRKRKNLSQDELAEAIHKTKSTLCKYESGQITIDVETLYEIASVLGVQIKDFVDKAVPTAPRASSKYIRAFSGNNKLHLYYYDGRTKRITRTLLVIQNGNTDDFSVPCMCYMDIPSFKEYDQCKYFYTGFMTRFELVTYVTLNNRFNPSEQIGLTILNPFQQTQDIWGLMFGISFNPISPFGVKFLVSNEDLSESELAKKEIRLTKSELKIIKDMNFMLLNTQEA